MRWRALRSRRRPGGVDLVGSGWGGVVAVVV